jgi:hypothetical protein
MQRIPANGSLNTVRRVSVTQNFLIFDRSGIALYGFRHSGSPHASTYSWEGTLSVITQNARPGGVANQRRSHRIVLSVPIIVSGKRANGSPFKERTTTLVVSAHGALIHLREAVIVGQDLSITHVGTSEELACTVKDINHGQEDIPEVGIGFAKPNAHFWRVSFPPDDWSPRHPEAKHFTKQSAPEMKRPEVKK